MNPRVWIKPAAVVCIGVVLDMLAHQLAFQVAAPPVSGTGGTTTLPPSAIDQLGLAVPAVLAFLLLTFAMLAVVFVLLLPNLPYSRWMKGV
jgi:hypothetical protein